MQNASLVTVDFHGHSLVTLKQDDQILVALKPIVEGIGLDWRGQHKRIQRDDVLSTCVVVMTMQLPGDTQRREVLFLPLQYLNGWLFGVDTSRIKNPEVRERINQYKRECYEVLYRYWHGKELESKTETLTPSEQQTLSEIVHARVQDLPDGLKGKALAEIWSRVHRKFRVAKYSQLPRTKLADAIIYITRMELKCAPKLEPEYLTNQDMANLRKIIGMIVSRVHYEGAWQYAIWKRLRYLCNCPAPNRFEVRHLPLLAAELKRIWAAEEKMFLFFGEVSKRVARDVVFHGVDIEEALKQSEEKAARMIADLRNRIGMTLCPWEQRYLDTLEKREALRDVREDLEKLRMEAI